MLFDRFRPSGALERPFWCSDEGRRLLAIDWIGVANAMCPNCGSGERHRLLWFYLRDNRDNFLPGARVLDIAPDKFIYKAFFKNANIDYRSIDINSNRNPTHLMDITDLKFDDASFDLILCSHVLEHIQDDLKAAQEICRVLKPTGMAIIQVPIWAEKTVEDKTIANPEARSAHFGHPDHVRRYGPDFADRIREAGLEVTLDNYATKLSCDILTRFGIDKYETLHICRRS
jgi:SAM-dependent methyltransferase